MKNKSTLQSILTGLFVVLVLAASNSIVRAQCPGTTTWTGGIGDWFAGANWSNGCVPNATTDASINNGGHAQIHGPLNDHAEAKSLILGDIQGHSGTLTIDGDDSAVLDLGTSSCRGDIYIGNRGKGELIIGNGGYIRSRYGYVAAVANPTRPTSSGKVEVDGFGSTWYLYDSVSGCTGAGLFIGSTATSNAGGTATVSLSNAAKIEVANRDDAAPGVKVGLSGTLAGIGLVTIGGGTTALSKTVEVHGTLAPKILEIRGNLNVDFTTANTIFHVTPQGSDSVEVTQLTGGGVAFLGGRVTVIMTGTFTPGMSFTLVHTEAGRNNTFDFESITHSGGPCISPEIQYDAYNVNLYIQTSCD